MQREAIIGLAIVITLAVLAPNQSQVEWSEDEGASANAPGALAPTESVDQTPDTIPMVHTQRQLPAEDASI